MAIGTTAHLLTASPPIPSPVLTSDSRLYLFAAIIPSTRFPSRSISIRLKPSLAQSFTQNRKHLALTPPRSLSGHNSPSPLPKLIPLPQIDISHLTPFSICKYSAVLALAIAAVKKTSKILLSPFFWLHFSWTWIFWPWILASCLALYGLYSASRHSISQATVVEQLAVVTSTVTWLTLVPPAHFNGFLEGWPIVLFFVYHYFFFFESSVRKRLYGDLLHRDHDPKWVVSLPQPFKIGFFILVVVGHWLAAYEGPELHLISGGWSNFGIWILVAAALFMRYHSVQYLAKYSEKVVVPMTVVQFGPYRVVRHPIYASTTLLFAVHCITLRAPLSLLFLMALCLVYYGRKAELEEAVMVESFGKLYEEYKKKVSMDIKIDEEDNSVILLNSFSKTYEDIVTTLTNSKYVLDMEERGSDCIHTFRRHLKKSTGTTSIDGVALYAWGCSDSDDGSGYQLKSRENPDIICNYCKKKGHVIKTL